MINAQGAFMNPLIPQRVRPDRWCLPLVLMIPCGLISCQPAAPVGQHSIQTRTESAATEPSQTTDAQIVAFCGGCHAFPSPTSFPKSAWYDEVKRGFGFYHQSQRKDLNPPPVQPVVDYFRSRAPEALPQNVAQSFPNPPRIHFRRTEVSIPQNGSSTLKPPAISFIGPGKHTKGGEQGVLFSDMANGTVSLATFQSHSVQSNSFPVTPLVQLQHPAAARQCDLDQNGRMGLVMAELGSFTPGDHDQGRVMWLADLESSGSTAVPLCEGIGRVADVQPADFDGDGDLDLIVAEFGWHQTGGIFWLENQGKTKSPQFIPHPIDPRPGTIQVPVVDLNQDGKPDFVAIISQEFEVIEAFFNQGDGTFLKKTIHAAGDPSFGSSGIQLADLDGDGDQDVVYTNGDMFDSFLIKPYHGVHWLENQGSFPFVLHPLTPFPGAHRAIAGDLDQDGDLDLIAGSFLPGSVRESEIGKQLESLIWLEQTRPGEFVRHALETGNAMHATLELIDLDGDGDLDLVTGSFRDRGSVDQSAITIWWNELSPP